MSRKTIEVDSDQSYQRLEELSKLIIRLDKNPKKTRKEQNTIKKIQNIRDTIQDSALYAKLKKAYSNGRIFVLTVFQAEMEINK
jgi:succinate dehydrogenase/fumarate reductase-like Fe-S protein